MHQDIKVMKAGTMGAAIKGWWLTIFSGELNETDGHNHPSNTRKRKFTLQM